MLNRKIIRFFAASDAHEIMSKREADSFKGAIALARGDTKYLQRRRNLVEAGMDWDEATRQAELSEQPPP